MNQDFALLPTPANMRRLQLLQGVCPIDIPDDLRALAAQDCLNEAAFDPLVCPYDLSKATITQFLLDCNLRAIVQSYYHPIFNRIALLHAVNLVQPQHIVIVSNKPTIWLPAIKSLRLTHRVTALTLFAVDDEFIDQHRHTAVLLIEVDLTSFRNKIKILTRVFPQTIIYDPSMEYALLTHWMVWARLLFPGMPHPLYTRMIKDTPGWCQQPLSAFAPFYNTCIFPHLITDLDIIEHMQDEHELPRLSNLAGMLIT